MSSQMQDQCMFVEHVLISFQRSALYFQEIVYLSIPCDVYEAVKPDSTRGCVHWDMGGEHK